MAGPSSQIARGFELAQHFYSSTPVLYGLSSVALAVGDVLEEDTAGLLALADTDDTTTVVGVCMSTATAAGQTVSYIPAWNGVIFEATFDNSTTTGELIAQANVYQQYGLGIDAGNLKPYVAKDETTATILTVIRNVDAIGASYGRVWVSFMQNKTIWGA